LTGQGCRSPFLPCKYRGERRQKGMAKKKRERERNRRIEKKRRRKTE
jgi:hypothetical protein